MATLNPEPAAPEEREAQNLPPKSFAEAVEDGPTDDKQNASSAGGKTANGSTEARNNNDKPVKNDGIASDRLEVKQGNAQKAQIGEGDDGKDAGGKTGNGLSEEKIKGDEPIKTEGVTSDKVQTEGGDMQKASLGKSSGYEKDDDAKSYAEVAVRPPPKESTSPKQLARRDSEKTLNGDVDEEDKTSRRRPSGNSRKDSAKSYAEVAVQPPPQESSNKSTFEDNNKDESRRPNHSRSSSFSYRIPKAASVVSFRSINGDQLDDSEFEDNDLLDNIRETYNGDHLTSIRRTPLSTRSSSMTKLSSKQHPSGDNEKDRSLVSGRIAGSNWHQSKIRFAPLNIPLQRRLQTFAVLYHTLVLAMAISTFLFMCAIPILWPLLVPYMVYVMFSKAGADGKLSFRSERVRRSKIWSAFASYFPMRLHRTQELSPTRRYLFGYHPHGIISHGAFAAFGTEALGFSQLFPGITNSLLTLDSNFRIPFYREYMLLLGLGSVSRRSCENLLTKGGVDGEGMGRAITIVVGGATESLDANPHTMRLTLKNRYGFVKMALRTGADLVPVIGFGENDLYDQLSAEGHPWIRTFQFSLKKVMGWTLPLFHARGVFNYDVGLLPYRRPVNVVVGRPIRVKQNKKPSMEEVEKLHREYCDELQRLWDTWKDDFVPNRKEELKIR